MRASPHGLEQTRVASLGQRGPPIGELGLAAGRSREETDAEADAQGEGVVGGGVTGVQGHNRVGKRRRAEVPAPRRLHVERLEGGRLEAKQVTQLSLLGPRPTRVDQRRPLVDAQDLHRVPKAALEGPREEQGQVRATAAGV